MAKQADVRIGQVWIAKVSNNLVEVRIDNIVEGKPAFERWPDERKKRMRLYCTNLKTRREVSMTAAKLRRMVKDSATDPVNPEAAALAILNSLAPKTV